MADIPLDPEALEAALTVLWVDERDHCLVEESAAAIRAYLAAEPPGVALARVFTEEELKAMAAEEEPHSAYKGEGPPPTCPTCLALTKLRSALEGEDA